MNKHRNQRALAVIRNLRGRQERQNQKIDILCRDMVGAHVQFSKKISNLTFVSRFYETLLSSSNIESLLDTAAAAIGARLGRANVAIFLLEADGFDVHFVKDPQCCPIPFEQIESWFTTEIVREISLSCRVCSVRQMLTMGLTASPKDLKRISAAAVPLGTLGQAAGFVLLWREAENPLSRAELETVASISAGLRTAIQSRSKPVEVQSTVTSKQSTI